MRSGLAVEQRFAALNDAENMRLARPKMRHKASAVSNSETANQPNLITVIGLSLKRFIQCRVFAKFQLSQVCKSQSIGELLGKVQAVLAKQQHKAVVISQLLFILHLTP